MKLPRLQIKRKNRFGKRFAMSAGALVGAACLACSAQQAPTNETTLATQQVEEKKILMQGSLAGIGAVLKKNNDQLVIREVFPGSPAEKAGLKAGQVVTAINAIPTTTMTIDDAVKLIRGPKGTQVELTVPGPSDTKPQQVTIVRDIVTLVAATGRVLDGNVGLLTITNFSEAVPKQVKNILESFATLGVKGVVLDLRDNGGGSLNAVVEVAGLFVGKEPVLWLHLDKKDKQAQPCHASENAMCQSPMVVLVNGMTAYGAELVASALQTRKRATVVGQKTFGKAANGSVENLTANGNPIDGVGIQPDVALDASLSKEEVLKKAGEVLSKQTDAKPKGKE